MKNYFKKSNVIISIILLCSLTASFKGYSQTETIPAGSFIINMGVVPQTVNNSLRPYGLVWDLIKYNKITVKWVINPSKAKDGIDFSYGGVNYRGGTFIIPKRFITSAVASKINALFPSVIVGAYTTTPLIVNVTYSLKYVPRWTFDLKNGSIAQDYLTRAGIPIAGYPIKYPNQLNTCDDLFAMPHADPVWDTHKNLLTWNKDSKGWIWAACHAVSAMENIYNPADPSMQLNFLSNKFSGFGAGQDVGNTWAANSLVLWGNHNDPITPFSYAYPADPEMQFMGNVEGGVGANGSERAFMPYNATSSGVGLSSSWRSTTKISVFDNSPAATNPNIPEKTDGPVALVAYGRAFGDTTRGTVMYEGGHSHNGTTAAFVAAQRIFFNFSFMSAFDKDPLPKPVGPTSITSNTSNPYTFTLEHEGFNVADYAIEWTSSCGGIFTNKHGVTTNFIPAGVASCTPCTITVTVTDACGRSFYEVLDIEVCPSPPVAHDKTCNVINNPPGTPAQTIAEATPLSGTDPDGIVVSYTLKSLPSASAGVLYYNHDGLPGTPDVPVLIEVILTPTQMSSIKFDPVDGFGGNASFLYTVTDNAGYIDLTPATYNIPINPPPVAQDFLKTPVLSSAGPTSLAPSLIATDNGTIINYIITTLAPPSQGILYLNGVEVTLGEVITPALAQQLYFDPSGTFVGYAAFTFTATDNDGAIDPTPATVTIQIVNVPPAATDITAPSLANPNGTGPTDIPDLFATDVDGTVTSYTIVSLPLAFQGTLYYYNGTSNVAVTGGQVLTITQAQNLRFDPVDGFTGVASFTYTATDNDGLVDNSPASYYIPVAVIPPVADDILNPSIYSGQGQTDIDNLSGSDPDATNTIVNFIITSLPDPAKGILYYFNGAYTPVVAGSALTNAEMSSLRFDPSNGATGNAVFSYTVTDDEGLQDQSHATFTIPITNAPPVAVNVTNPILNSSDGPVTINPLIATDADGVVVSYVITTLPAASKGELLLGGVPVIKGQQLTPAQISTLEFDPAHGSSGNAVFYFSATDDQGATDPTPATFTIPINLILIPPVAEDKLNPVISVNANSTNIIPITATDTDGTIFSYQIKTIPIASQGLLLLSGVPVTVNQVFPAYLADQLYFDPSGIYTGNVVFNYTAIDNDGLPDATPATFTIPVNNFPPTSQDIVLDSLKTGRTEELAPLIGFDADGSISSFTIVTMPTPNLGTLQVALVAGGAYTNVFAGQVLTPQQATRMRFIAGSTVGTTVFTYTATDNNLTSDPTPANYTIPIRAIGGLQPPIADDKLNTPMNVSNGLTPILPFTGTDPDGSIVSYIILSIPPPYMGTLYYINSSSILTEVVGGDLLTPDLAATLRFDPTGNYIGNVVINYTATDDDNNVDPTPATYTIPIFNNPPATTNIVNASMPSSAGPTPISALIATDTDGSIFVYSITTLPTVAMGILYLDGVPVLEGQYLSVSEATRLQFDPSPTFTGNAVFNYTATDNLGDVDMTPASFTIPVTNQPPVTDPKVSQVITNQVGTGQQNIPALTGTDLDGFVVSFIINTIPVAASGVLYFNGTPVVAGLEIPLAQASLLTFDPADGYGLIATFTYSAKDNLNLIDLTPALYEIPINSAPATNNVSSPAMYAGAANTPIPPLVGTDDDYIDFFSITILPPVAQGSLYLNGVLVTSLSQVDTLSLTQINQLSFTPSASFTGTTFTYTATDNLGVIDVTPAVYSLPVKILVFGNVWNDYNGNILKDAPETVINGSNSGAGTNTGAVLYMNLIDVNGIVVATTPLLNDGSYIFYDILENKEFIIQLTTNQGVVGQAKPATQLSNNWVSTGENKNGQGGVNDNTANSEITVFTSNQSIGGQDFGIQQLPDSDNHSTFISQPVINQEIILNGNSNPPVLSGIDPEDCTTGCTMISRSVVIDQVPTNSELYYNNVLVSNGQRINNFDPSLLKVRVTGATMGSTNTRFRYSYIDIANKQDPTSAIYTIFWAGALPAEGLVLSASLQGNIAALKWETLSENNTSHFEVQRSIDKQNFAKTGINVFAAGNSTTQKQYQLADDITNLQSSSIIYYRVKLIDLDGKITYSNTVAVRFSKKPEVTIFPNPFHSIISVSISTEVETIIELKLIDISGKLIRKISQKASKGINQITINNLDQLPGGVYLIEITDQKAGTTYQKLLKNNY